VTKTLYYPRMIGIAFKVIHFARSFWVEAGGSDDIALAL
jgi:hypothetical protein